MNKHKYTDIITIEKIRNAHTMYCIYLYILNNNHRAAL